MESGKSFAARDVLQRIRGGPVDDELAAMESGIRDQGVSLLAFYVYFQ